MQPARPTTEYAAPPNPAASRTGQFAYETFYGAAIGGATVALLVLVLDAVGGRPLHTPSIMGTALFTGTDPSAAADVRLDMVALYSAVHFVAFLVIGALASAVHSRLPTSGMRPLLTVVLLFVLLTAGFAVATGVALPGVGAVIGWHWVLVANAATAVAMSVFLERAAEA